MRCGGLRQVLPWQPAAGLLFCLCLLSVTHVDANYEKTCTREDRLRPRGYCGPQLTEMLSAICQSQYNKRSSPGFLSKLNVIAGQKAGSADLLTSRSDDSIFLPNSRALSFLRSSKRAVYDYDSGWDDVVVGAGQRGLSCECCVHMCSYSEMVEYCQHPAVRKRLGALQTRTR